jgi:hypothetical protein
MAIAAFALLACRTATDIVPPPASPASTAFTVHMVIDSANVYEPAGACGGLYCFKKVPSTGEMTARLTVGPATTDLSPPMCCLGTIVGAFSDVRFADSLSGKAVIDTDSILTVAVGVPVTAEHYATIDYFTFTGIMQQGRYVGRWRQQIDAHGLGYFGSFVAVP